MLAEQSVVLERCVYTYLSSGIHKFAFTESSAEAVDEWFDMMETLYNSHPNGVLRILVDSSEIGVQPLSYASQRVRQVNANYPNRPATRTAFLYRTNFLASLARTFIIMFSRVGVDKVQFFPGDNREQEALTWLLRNN